MKELLFYGGNILIIGYLVIIIGKQLYETNKLKQRRQAIETQYYTAKQEMDLVRRDNLVSVGQAYSKVYGNDITEKIAKRIVFEDMPMILLLVSCGLPDKIQEGFNRGKSLTKWYYGESYNRLGNEVYEFEVTVEDYVVVGWRDLR